MVGVGAKSEALAPLYKSIAQRYGATFLDAGSVTAVSLDDGLHLDAEGHQALASAIAALV